MLCFLGLLRFDKGPMGLGVGDLHLDILITLQMHHLVNLYHF